MHQTLDEIKEQVGLVYTLLALDSRLYELESVKWDADYGSCTEDCPPKPIKPYTFSCDVEVSDGVLETQSYEVVDGFKFGKVAVTVDITTTTIETSSVGGGVVDVVNLKKSDINTLTAQNTFLVTFTPEEPKAGRYQKIEDLAELKVVKAEKEKLLNPNGIANNVLAVISELAKTNSSKPCLTNITSTVTLKFVGQRQDVGEGGFSIVVVSVTDKDDSTYTSSNTVKLPLEFEEGTQTLQ